MKILLYDNSHLPVLGGKEIVVHHLAQAYQARGHEVVVAGPSGPLQHRHLHYGYPVHRWARLRGVPHPLDWRIHFVIQRLRFDFDVVHAHTTYPTGYTTALMQNWHRRPFVITPHGADIHKVEAIGFGRRLDPVLDEKIRYALERADVVTAISQAVEASILDAGTDPAKVVAIPNGADTERFARPATLDVRAHLDLPRDARLFVSVGNYHPRKGHEVLVDAFRQVVAAAPDARLVIVGARPRVVREKVEADGLSAFVKHIGVLPFPTPGTDSGPDVLVALLQTAHAYVSSSMAEGTEGLSLALLEAMAAGAPPVATRVSGNVDIVRDGENGLLAAPGDVDSLACAMLAMLADRAARDRYAAAAQAAVAPFSWLAVADRYLALFERLTR
jgi:glycosyltransferase involved in cell wall biosynthesis